MHDFFIWAAIALCLFSLWALLRHDWLRLTLPMRRVTGRVTGHRTGLGDESKDYAAIYAFNDETGRHETIDAVYSSRPKPEVGTLCELTYPAGHPGLARPPRLWLWLGIYAMLLAMTGLLFAIWMGWVQD